MRSAQCGEAADRRAEDEADAERGPEQTEQSRALLGWSDVGDCGLGDGQAATRRAVDDPSDEQDPHAPAAPVMKLPTAVPSRAMTMTGLRPM